MARDDARLNRGDAIGIRDQAFVRNAGVRKAAAQDVRVFVGAGDSERSDLGAKRGEIGRDIAGSAQAGGLRNKIDHRHGGLGRKPRGLAPNVAVEHEVADDADAASLQAAYEALETSGSGHD